MRVCEWLMGGDDGFEPPTLFYAKCPSYLHQSYATRMASVSMLFSRYQSRFISAIRDATAKSFTAKNCFRR